MMQNPQEMEGALSIKSGKSEPSAEAVFEVFQEIQIPKHCECRESGQKQPPRALMVTTEITAKKLQLGCLLQSATRETTTRVALTCSPEVKVANRSSKGSSSKGYDNTDDAWSSLAEFAHIETASSSDSDSSDEEERRNHQGSHRNPVCTREQGFS